MGEENEIGILRMHIEDLTAELRRLRGHRPAMRIRTGPNGRTPLRIHPGDAGYDLHTSQTTTIPPGCFVDIPTDVYVQMPHNMWSLIIGRSSTLRKRGLMVTQGIIDQGFRGELFAGAWNLTNHPVQIEQGERIAQLIPMPLLAGELAMQITHQLDAGDRGENGFGSTGH